MIRRLDPGILTLTVDSNPFNAGNFAVKALLNAGYSVGDPVEVLDGPDLPGEEESKPSLEVEFLESYDAESMIAWLHKNKGKEAEFVFVPSKKGKLKATGKVQIVPANLGGEIGKENKQSITMKVIGDYELHTDYAE